MKRLAPLLSHALLLGLVAWPASNLHAFDYPEHQFITARAFVDLALLCDQPPTTPDPLFGLAQAPCTAFADFIRAGFDAIGSSDTCRPEPDRKATEDCERHGSQCADYRARSRDKTYSAIEHMFGLWSGRSCLSLADLPALAGDHAGSPLLLKWRWFDDCVYDRDQECAVRTLLRIAYNPGTLDEPPEATLTRKPDTRAFVQAQALTAWPAWPATATDGGDLHALDDTAIPLRARSAQHFRPALLPATAGALAERYSYHWADRSARHKPARHALAWYADLHLGALHAAAAAGGVTDEDERQHPGRRATLVGVAVLLESSALHYLQDTVAPGHIVPDALRLTASAVTATHEAYNSHGLVAKLPPAIAEQCRVSPPSYIAGLCSAASGGRVRVFGDTRLSEQCRPTATRTDCDSAARLAPDAAQSLPSDWRATSDWAAFLTMTSVAEVVRELADPRVAPEISAACADTPPGDPAYTFHEPPACGLRDFSGAQHGNESYYRCMFAWWEAPTSANARSAAIQRAWDDRYFAAARSIPIPEGTSKTFASVVAGFDGDFSGPGLELGLGVAQLWTGNRDDARPGTVFHIGFPWTQNVLGGGWPNYYALPIPGFEITALPAAGGGVDWRVHALFGVRWDTPDRVVAAGLDLLLGYSGPVADASGGAQAVLAWHVANGSASMTKLFLKGAYLWEGASAFSLSFGIEFMSDLRGPRD